MSSITATQFLPVVATPAAAKNFMVLSIHDVAPSTQTVVTEMIERLGREGVSICSLLVVPDYHHQGVAMNDPQFVSWLRRLEAARHEVVIHGYFHQRERRNHETLRDKLITRFYTHDEGEFYDLTYDEALCRIKSAQDEFRGAGLNPRGFVAPAWLLSAEGERAARDLEVEYTTRLGTVRDLRSGTDFSARSLVYSVRSSWRRSTSLVWNAALGQMLKLNPLLRISVHPPDYAHPAVWRQIVDLVRAGSAERTATTYQDWIAEQRVSARL